MYHILDNGISSIFIIMNLIKSHFTINYLYYTTKGNTIYNLIKIPNLEIYEINTKNKLKYFYAARPLD